jgi:DNA-binding NtrC family response regulator
VEDDVLVSQATKSLLEVLGAKVDCFHNAEQALLHEDIEGADYYLVDYMLGGTLNGIQLLNKLQLISVKPIKAVLMTGDTSSNFIREATNFEWPVQYKPVNVPDLLSSLRAQQELQQIDY